MLTDVSYETLSNDEKIALKVALLYPHTTIGDALRELLNVSDVKSLYNPIAYARGNLKRKGLLDGKGNPTDVAFEIVPCQEAKQHLKKLNKEVMQIDKLKNQLEEENRKLNNLLQPPVIIKPELLERGIENYLGHDLAANLSPKTKSDLNDAMKCLRCGIATPAAMISLRAAEDVVRKYYEHKIQEKPVRMGLKDILDKLMERSDVDKTLVGYLNYIREKRNTAEHPEKIFTQKESEETFIKVTDAVKEIQSQT
jgi:hypothetical protein